MEKIAEEMAGLLQEILGLYQDLKGVLIQEKDYIIAMDVENIWGTTEQKKSLVQQLEEHNQSMMERARRHLVHFESDSKGLELRDVVSALPLALEVKSRLKAVVVEINACKTEIALLARDNKRYITEYLSVIDGIFGTVRQQSEPRQYSQYGQMRSDRGATSLISAEV